MSEEQRSAAEKPAETAEQEQPTAEKPAKAKEVSEKAEKPAVKRQDKPAENEEKKKAPRKREPVKPIEDFNWEALDASEDNYDKAEREKLAKLYDEKLTTIEEHAVLDGSVTTITKKEVLVNIGYKSEGVIAVNEFRYNPDLKEGDQVEVYVENIEDKNGQLLLSHAKARTLRAWERVNQALQKEEVITGLVKCRTKGGLIADVFGIEAFLPGSQIDVKPIRDYDLYVGKNMEFKVVKINHEFRNVVVSHKALIEAELEQQKAEIMSKLEKGQVLEGTVKNITSYGVFVDLGGVDGLVHITDLSWGRINHPEEMVKLDEKINVVILDFDDEKKRIALGLKQLTPHPWDSLNTELQAGDKIKGKVVVMADYGAFVEIQTGVEGLVHVSEMSWSQHLRSAQDFFKVGDEVEAVIMTLDREERKMSLSTRRLTPDPWDGIQQKYPVNSTHTGRVTNISNFGVFVELEEGIDGLVHISDLSWSKKINHPSEFTKVDEQIEIMVLEIDLENRRLSLGHKQLKENPWNTYETIFTEGSVHQGKIINRTEKGGVVELPHGVEGYAPSKHLVKQDGNKGEFNEILDFKVLEFNKENKRILLSHTNTFAEEEQVEKKREAKAAKKAVKQMQDSIEKSTLGDLDALSNLKEEMKVGEVETAKKKPRKKAKKEETPEVVAEEEKKPEPPAEDPNADPGIADEAKKEE